MCVVYCSFTYCNCTLCWIAYASLIGSLNSADSFPFSQSDYIWSIYVNSKSVVIVMDISIARIQAEDRGLEGECVTHDAVEFYWGYIKWILQIWYIQFGKTCQYIQFSQYSFNVFNIKPLVPIILWFYYILF